MCHALLSRFASHVARKPDAPAFTFIRRHDDPGQTLTWAGLWRASEGLAGRMPPRDGREAGVLICCREPQHFVVALLAAWMRGHWAIPAASGSTVRPDSRNRHIVRVASPDIVLHDLPVGQAQDLLADAPPGVACIDLGAPGPDRAAPCPLSDGEGGLVQFTSGSTSAPKAVRLGAEQIAANCGAIARAYGIDGDSVGVHWLPLHHDMGLIGSVVVPLWTGCRSIVLDPMVFIQRPVAWLEQVAAFRGTITSAPNFAFDRLCRAAGEEELAGLDLSSLRTVISGGEQVRRDTVERTIAVLGPRGLAPGAIAPSYGMAEVTLLVSSGQSPGGPRFSDRRGGTVAACLGPVIPELSVEIRDPGTGAPLPEGAVGEIHLSGPSAGQVIPAGASWRDPPAPGGIATGDHGYLDGGEIFVTGRVARKLIVRGRNIFAEDVEQLAHASQAGRGVEGIAAIGIDAEGSQQLCLLIELNRRALGIDLPGLNTAIVRDLGVKPARVVLLRGAILPRTTSGKIRHDEARRAFLAGDYQARTLDHVLQTRH